MGVFSIPLPVLQTREFERHGHSTSITIKTHNSILFTCGMHAGLLGLSSGVERLVADPLGSLKTRTPPWRTCPVLGALLELF